MKYQWWPGAARTGWGCNIGQRWHFTEPCTDSNGASINSCHSQPSDGHAAGQSGYHKLQIYVAGSTTNDVQRWQQHSQAASMRSGQHKSG